MPGSLPTGGYLAQAAVCRLHTYTYAIHIHVEMFRLSYAEHVSSKPSVTLHCGTKGSEEGNVQKKWSDTLGEKKHR